MYESINLLQASRFNLFTSTEDDTTYQLDDTNIDEVELVEVLNNNAEWVKKTKNDDYTVDLAKGQVKFLIAVGKPPVDGRDNVRIKFKKNNNENKSQINKCTIMCTYGYDGNNNRAFLTGNSDYPNIVNYSYIVAVREAPPNVGSRSFPSNVNANVSASSSPEMAE